MKIERGLFDHMVLQRNRRNLSDAVFAGTCRGEGDVIATIRRGGKPLRGFRGAIVGRAGRGRFQGRLKGIPVGGPYAVTIEITNGGRIVETLIVKDVLVGDVWIVAGQSNAQGCGFLNDAPRAHARVRAFYMDDRWGPAQDPIHNMWKTVDQVHIDLLGGRPPKNTITGAGPGVPFGRRMLRRTGIPQGLLACAHGGTSMAQWDPALKKLGGKSLYGAMMRRFRKNGGTVAGVIWYQGCSDASPESAALYTGRMKKLVSSMRRDFGNPDLPFVLVQISRVVGGILSWGSASAWNSIQDQQRRLPNAIRRCATVPAIDLSLEDAIHIGGRGQIAVGQRLADAMLALTRGSKTGKPPMALKKCGLEIDRTRTMMNLVVEFDHVVGKLVAPGRPAGFSVIGEELPDQVYDVQLRGNKAIVRMGVSPIALAGMNLHYGFGTNPYCNITDEAGRSLPVFGPVPVVGTRATTGFIRRVRVSRFMPSAGKLGGLRYPRNKAALKLRRRDFAGDFLDLHLELQKLAPEDVRVFYACDFECGEPMKLAALLGYDGPLKVWVDGKQRFHDPRGTNPALPEKGVVKFAAGRGPHEALVALGSNFGRAWGIFLAFERLDVSRRLLKKGPRFYAMPKILVP